MPNLVFIMSDEARKDVVFHDKYPFVRTPNIDSLRGEAVSFHHCFANYPVCVPSRSLHDHRPLSSPDRRAAQQSPPAGR